MYINILILIGQNLSTGLLKKKILRGIRNSISRQPSWFSSFSSGISINQLFFFLFFVALAKDLSRHFLMPIIHSLYIYECICLLSKHLCFSLN